jgi:hypothetical protein
MNKTILVMFSLFMSSFTQAELLVCGEKEIDRIQIQANREDNHSHANTMLLRFKDTTCNNRKYAYISR